MSKERLDYLDSLRGIAAMSVVIFHCLISFNIFHKANYESIYSNAFLRFFTESPLKLFWSGKEAVLLFFVLSGFVLSISFFKGRAYNYPIFTARRFARIYIPYIVIMIASVVLTTIFINFKDINGMSSTFNNRWDHEVSLQAIIAYVFMLNYDTANVNGVVWTLYHEMRISLVFPLIVFFIAKYRPFVSNFILLGIILVIYAVFHVLSQQGGYIGIIAHDFKGTAFYSIFFVMGATLSKYRLEVSHYLKKQKSIILLFLFVVSLILINSSALFKNNSSVADIVAGLGIVLLFSVVLSSKKAQKFLSTKPFLWLGKISYSLYLIHILVLMSLAILLGNVIGIGFAVALTPLVSLPVAWVVYEYIEKPSIEIGRSWTDFLKSKQVNKKISA